MVPLSSPVAESRSINVNELEDPSMDSVPMSSTDMVPMSSPVAWSRSINVDELEDPSMDSVPMSSTGMERDF